MMASAKALFSDKPLQDIEHEIGSLISQNIELNRILMEQKKDSEKIVVSLLRDYAELTERISCLAQNSGQENDQTKQLIISIKELEERLKKILKRFKVKPLKVVIGKTADNAKHRVKKTVKEKDKKDGTILEVTRQGYVWKGYILRRAEVKVARNLPKKQMG